MFKRAIVLVICAIIAPYVAMARTQGAYFGYHLTKTNTHSIERDIRGDAGGGTMRISGKVLKVSGNEIPANNGEVDLIRGNSRGFGAKLLAGYQVNDYLAWELAYNKFSDGRWKGGEPADDLVNRMYAVDITALGYYPLMYKVDFKAGLGIAYINSSLISSSIWMIIIL